MLNHQNRRDDMGLEQIDELKSDDDDDSADNEFVEGVIDWSKLTESLLKVKLGSGILSVMVLSSNGTLLSSVGDQSKSAKRIIPPLLTSIWQISNDVGKKFVDARLLEFMFINCKLGTIAVSALIPEDVTFFVCVLAEKKMELGLLKVKCELISDQLAKILFNDEDDDDEDNDDDDEVEDKIILAQDI